MTDIIPRPGPGPTDPHPSLATCQDTILTICTCPDGIFLRGLVDTVITRPVPQDITVPETPTEDKEETTVRDLALRIIIETIGRTRDNIQIIEIRQRREEMMT